MESSDCEYRVIEESVLSERLRNLNELVFGTRAKHFDALLNTIPTNSQLTAISDRLGKPTIDNVILTVDGTLAPPYGRIYQEALAKTKGYIEGDRKVAVHTDNTMTARIEKLRRAGVIIPRSDMGSLPKIDFNELCEQCEMDPAHTAMIGNSAIDDMPFVADGTKPFFPLNILIKSIPPVRGLIEPVGGYGPHGPSEPVEGDLTREMVHAVYMYHGLKKRMKEWAMYRRAKINHLIANAAAGIVRRKNPTILRSSDLNNYNTTVLQPSESVAHPPIQEQSSPR